MIGILLELPELSVPVLTPVLSMLQAVNVQWLLHHPTPPLNTFFPRVFYFEDPHHDHPCPIGSIPADSACSQERFSAIPAILRRGYADCKDFAAWLAAEMNVRGDPAARAIAYQASDKLIHVVVLRGDGTRDDPSERFGMRSYFDAKDRGVERAYFRRMRLLNQNA